MIRIYDSNSLDPEKGTSELIFAIDTPNTVGCLLMDAVHKSEKKYKCKSYYYRTIMFGNGHEDKKYDKYYLGIDWGSHSHFIKIVFDTEAEYKQYVFKKDEENK